MKMYGGVQVWLREFLTSILSGNQQVDPYPGRFILSEINKKFPLQIRLRGP